MQKRTLILLWSLVILLGALILFEKYQNKDHFKSVTRYQPGDFLFQDLNLSQVNQVTLQSGKSTTTLLKHGNTWSIKERENYPANQELVAELLRGLPQLKVIQSIEAGKSYAPRFGMDEKSDIPADSGLNISLNSPHQPALHFTIGKKVETQADGRFLRRADDENGFYVVGVNFGGLQAGAGAWISPDFFQIERVKSIEVNDVAGIPQWKIERANERSDGFLVGASQDDVLKKAYRNAIKKTLSSIVPFDVMTAEKVTQARKEAKISRAVFETFDGLRYELEYFPLVTPQPAVGQLKHQLYVMQIKVKGDLPLKRSIDGEESPEQAKVAEETWQQQREKLAKKIVFERSLENRAFLVSDSMLDCLTKARAELLENSAPVPPSE